MTAFEEQIRQTLAEMAEATPVSSAPQFDQLRTPTSGADEGMRGSGRVIMAAASIVLVIAGVVAIAIIGSRDEPAPADTTSSLRVEPNVVMAGDWVTVTGDTRWRWEAFLDRVDGDARQRIWMLYPTSEFFLTPQSPVDLRDEPDAGLTPIQAANPMNKFRIPQRAEPGAYQICRVGITAGTELCADLTIHAPTSTP